MKLGSRFLALVIGAAFWTAVPAHASVIAAVQFVTAFVASTGNELDVTITNNGSSPVDIASFIFAVSTADTDIMFTSTTINTSSAPYIFAGNSIFGPTINTDLPGQAMDGGDVYGGSDTSCSPPNPTPPPAALPAFCLAAGSKVALGNVQFDVSKTAATGPFAVTLSTLITSLSDANGANVPIDFQNSTNGQINILATPEPASVLLLGGALLGLGLVKRRRSR